MVKEITLKTKNIIISSLIVGLLFTLGYNSFLMQSLAEQQNILPIELFVKMPSIYIMMFICMFVAFSIFFILFVTGIYFMGLDKNEKKKIAKKVQNK